MMISNKTNSSYFSKRVKSPYVMQYLAFEDRVNAPPRSRHPLMMSNQQNGKNGKQSQPALPEQTLAEVKEFIQRKNEIWGEEKENLRSPEAEHMLHLRERIERIKSRHGHTLRPTPLDSQQLSRQKTVVPSLSAAGIRSRAVSQNSLRPRPAEQKGVVTFMQYKKSRRELSTKFR